MNNYIEEKKIEKINILIAFLIGIAAALFIVASTNTFNLNKNQSTTLIIITGVIYLVIIVALLYPKKTKTEIEPAEPQIIERTVEKIIEKPAKKQKPIVKYQKVPVREIHKELIPIAVEKKKPKKSKYVGSKYNEKYHLRTCRFSGAIKKKYLIEEDNKRFFKLRGYEPCKVCEPDKN